MLDLYGLLGLVVIDIFYYTLQKCLALPLTFALAYTINRNMSFLLYFLGKVSILFLINYLLYLFHLAPIYITVNLKHKVFWNHNLWCLWLGDNDSYREESESFLLLGYFFLLSHKYSIRFRRVLLCFLNRSFSVRSTSSFALTLFKISIWI